MAKQIPDQLYAMRHSLAHIMAAAIQQLWPQTKFGVGPVIENGWYYDVDLGDYQLSEEDLPKIESKMRELIDQNQKFVRSEKSLVEAKAWAKENNQNYKLELLEDLENKGTTAVKDLDSTELIEKTDVKVSTVSFYTVGDFIDLCRGPHIGDTSEVGAFKLDRIAGAYWRGDEQNPMLSRIYGLAFETQADLDEYLAKVEAAKQNDHRVLGKKLDLFTFSEIVGAGLPLYTPRGTVVRNTLKNALFHISRRYGGQEVAIPHIAKIDLYQASGHAAKFEEELFTVKSHYGTDFVLKPVNCPHHIQIYRAQSRSYRDLPLSYLEFTTQYRDEKPGQIGGLSRTRGFTVDDGHVFCTLEQVKEEVTKLTQVIKEFYTSLGMYDDHWVSLSVREARQQAKYVGEVADWDRAEEMLGQVCRDQGLEAKVMEGEAAIYGPKIDFMFPDVLGRDIQLSTIQLDFAMPKRFKLTYVDDQGSEQTPVMIHRAIAGSFERFLAILLERTGGNLPIWLSPEQVRIVTVNDDKKTTDYTVKILKELKHADIRATLDDSSETVGKKIREAEIMKVPYTLVIGDKEVQSGEVIPRVRQDLHLKHRDQPVSLKQFIQIVSAEAPSIHDSAA